jgi:hypothetical protein
MSDRVHATGSVTGTGSALNVIKLGFRPRMVKIFNAAAGGLCSLEWNDAMPEAGGFKSAPHADTQFSFLTTTGITPLANGFTIGADTDLNVSGEVIYYEAWD